MRMATTFTSDFNEEQLDALEKELESGKFVPLCRQHNNKGMIGKFNSLDGHDPDRNGPTLLNNLQFVPTDVSSSIYIGTT